MTLGGNVLTLLLRTLNSSRRPLSSIDSTTVNLLLDLRKSRSSKRSGIARSISRALSKPATSSLSLGQSTKCLKLLMPSLGWSLKATRLPSRNQASLRNSLIPTNLATISATRCVVNTKLTFTTTQLSEPYLNPPQRRWSES